MERLKIRAETVRRALPPLFALLASIALGWAISAAVSGRPHPPADAELEWLCAVEPGVRARNWTHIIIHHSHGRVGDAASIDRYHRRRGWPRGLGYDFVIGNGSLSGDGEIEVGHRWLRQLDGAHCKADAMNERAIGICFVGTCETNEPTRAQVVSGIALVRHLAARFGIPPDHILGHGEVAGARTRCPGRRFPIDRFRAAGHRSPDASDRGATGSAPR